MRPRHHPLAELVARARELPLATDAAALLAGAAVSADDGDLVVQWRERRPLVVLCPVVAGRGGEWSRDTARAIVALNARLPVPGFGLDARGTILWCTIVRRQLRGVPLQTLRAHVELAAAMAAFGARHFAQGVTPPGARRTA